MIASTQQRKKGGANRRHTSGKRRSCNTIFHHRDFIL